MSRIIDLTKPLSDDDRAFLEERGQYIDLSMNQAHLSATEAAAAVEPEKAPEDDESKAPNKSASKPEWVAYAVTKGMPADDAEAKTRDELIAQFAV